MDKTKLFQKKSQYTVAYAAGPGDVISSYRHWSSGRSDPNEVSETYSGQFFQQIKELDLTALVISSNARAELVKDDRFTLEHRPMNSHGKKGLAFHLSDIGYWVGIILSIKKHGCSLAVISNMEHWWLLFLLRLAGVKVVPSLHCTFWPKGCRQKGLKDLLIQRLNGLFWRNVSASTICISPECAHQVEILTGNKCAGPLLQARPKYLPDSFSTITQPDWKTKPFRLMFAGRIELNKGVFDMLSVMEKLIVNYELDVHLDICGSGSAFSELEERITKIGFEACIKLHGKLNQKAMLKVYQTSHVVVVPTTSGFPEGLNKVVVEGVLAGRPVIATSVTPAAELFPGSVIEVEPGNINQIVECIFTLATDEAYYSKVRSHCQSESTPFYDQSHSWGAAVSRSIHKALASR